MEALAGMMTEVQGEKVNIVSNSTASKEISSDLETNQNQLNLLLTGYNDWDNTISNDPAGFELSDLSLMVMGKNDHGQLGTGDLKSCHSPTILDIDFPSPVIKVAVGKSHTLILLENGKVFGCGSNSSGQLGLGDSKTAIKDYLRPVELPLEHIVDVSAGESFSLACSQSGKIYSFGHPEFGQLGFGSTGEYIKDGGKKGAAIQYNCVYRPKVIPQFYVKDHHNKAVEVISADNIRFRKVSAGKNHAVCMEDWEEGGLNRVFSWGFGGYGRLGHNGSSDELCPREVSFFNQTTAIKMNPQKNIRDVYAGSAYTLAVSQTKGLYFWGKLSNSPRGEATVYPKLVQDLCGFQTHSMSGGNNCVFVVADEACVGWGIPVAGKFGFENGVKSSTSPKYITDLTGMNPVAIDCGYGHVCAIVSPKEGSEGWNRLMALPELVVAPTAPLATAGKGGKKRPSLAEEKEKPSKKKSAK